MNDDAHETHQHDSSTDPPTSRDPNARPASANAPEPIATTDPVVEKEASSLSEWQRQPITSVSTNPADLSGAGPVFLSTPRPVIVEPEPSDADDNPRSRPASQKKRDSRSSSSGNQNRQDEDDDDESEDHSTGWGSLLGALAVGVLLGMLGFWAYGHFFGSNKDQQNQNSDSSSAQNSNSGDNGSSSDGSSSTNSKAADIAGFGSPDEARNLHSKIEELAERIDRLRMRVDHMNPSDNAPPPGLSTLQIRVGELSREVDDVAYLPERVRRMENQLDDLKQQIRGSKNADSLLSGSNDQNSRILDQPRSPTPAVNTSTPLQGPQPDEPAVIDLNNTSSSLDQGIRLLQQARAVEALDVLRSLENQDPNDARVWYLAALASGDATDDWDGEARRQVLRGLALERRNLSSSALVDRTLDRLEGHNVRGLDWLKTYRKQGLASR